MAKNARIVDVLIASPGDATPGRDAIERALHDWNTHRSDDTGQMLRPRRWETGSIPILGRGDGQTLINQQLVDQADIVFAIFYNRVGSATPRAISGTVEEIRRSVASGRPVHLYFSEMQRPSDVDLDQLILLRDLRTELQNEGLVGTFRSEEELRRLVANAIEYDLSRMDSRPPEPLAVSHEVATESTRTPSEPSHEARQHPQATSYTPSTARSMRLSRKQRLWLVVALSVVALVFLSSISPKAPEPAPAWIAIPGVLIFVALGAAIGKLIIIKIGDFRRRYSAGR